jgi:hypothetical protein
MMNRLVLTCASVCFAAAVGAGAASAISTSFTHLEVVASQAVRPSD